MTHTQEKQELQIKLKVEQMIHYGYSAMRNFPKSEKHVLCAEVRTCMFGLLRLVIVVNRRYAEGRTHFPQVKQQLASWIAHARHGDALPAVARYLNSHPFRRSRHDRH